MGVGRTGWHAGKPSWGACRLSRFNGPPAHTGLGRSGAFLLSQTPGAQLISISKEDQEFGPTLAVSRKLFKLLP